MNLLIKLIIFFLISTTKLFGQDLIADVATKDLRLQTTHMTKIIQDLKMKEEKALAKAIYADRWSNDGVNIYKDMDKPEKLIICLEGFCFPIKSKVVTSNFGYRSRFKRNHYGIDIKGNTGDSIYAAFDGKVRVRKYDGNGFGYYIVIRHNNGLETVYGHLSKQLVVVNQHVKAGQVIGLCGNTGHSFGSHLHFETRVLGEAIDPSLLFDFANRDVIGEEYVYRKTNHVQNSAKK